MQRQPLARQAFEGAVQERSSELELLGLGTLFAQGAAHERAVAAGPTPVDDLGEHRFVELHDGRPRREQGLDLLAKHAHHVVGQFLPRLVDTVRDAFEPHRPGQQIRSRQGDLHRPVGQAPDRLELVHGQWASGVAGEPPENGRVADGLGGDVEGPQLAGELVGVLHVGEQVDDRDELAVLEPAADEAGVAVPALFSVGHEIDARFDLGLDDLGHGAVGQLLEPRFVHAAFEPLVQGPQQPVGPGPAPDAAGRERGDAGRSSLSCQPCRSFHGPRLRARDRRTRVGTARHRGSGNGRHETTLGDEEAPAFRFRVVPGRDQLVARHPAPGRQVLGDRRLGREDLEQLPGVQRVDPAADLEQQPVAAVHVAAVEPVRRFVRMAIRRVRSLITHDDRLSRRNGSARLGCC